MEVMEFDAETITIRMRRRDELVQLFGLVVSVSAQYSSLDPYELDMTEEQVRHLLTTFHEVMRQIQPVGR